MAPTRVLIVDDSAIVRQVLSGELAKHPRIDVVGMARDVFQARDMIVELKPDVLTLDVEMPKMNGIAFLRKLMRHYPLPVVIFSSLARKGGDIAMQALDAGALAVLCKPTSHSIGPGMADELARTVIAISKVDPKKAQGGVNTAKKDLGARLPLEPTNLVLAIGASTGGTQALEALLMRMPPNMPGTIVSQHLPELFTMSFANRLANVTNLDVREARDGDRLSPGIVLIAPGDKHLMLSRAGSSYMALVKSGPLVNRHRPSVDVMFKSAARVAGRNAIGVILTGMGRDGAEGLLNMKNAGAFTIAQDERTSVVFGMPKAAIELDAASSVLGLRDIPNQIVRICRQKGEGK